MFLCVFFVVCVCFFFLCVFFGPLLPLAPLMLDADRCKRDGQTSPLCADDDDEPAVVIATAAAPADG